TGLLLAICRRSPSLLWRSPRLPKEDDGLLRASDVSQLKLNADWVVLSACNTAAADGTARAPIEPQIQCIKLAKGKPILSIGRLSLSSAKAEAADKQGDNFPGIADRGHLHVSTDVQAAYIDNARRRGPL